MPNRNNFLFTTALVSSLALSPAAFAADLYVEGEPIFPTVLPAVSGVNGKIAFQGGAFEDEGFGLVTGSLSLPIGTRYGFQADGLAGMRDEDFVGGGAGHLFWRDPSLGLLGIYGSYTLREDIGGDVARIGVEGEYYWSNWTAKALVGAEFLDAGNAFVEPDDGFFAFSDISYYLDENLELSVGHRYTNERNALALGAEYQLSQTVFSSGVSLFAEGRIGEDDYNAVWGGVRFYLGDDKSLMRRHREDDPTQWNDEDLFDLEAKADGDGGSEIIICNFC